ncbi:MAG: substrate-binding domain-containing protein, partial [Clostridia bacterium]
LIFIGSTYAEGGEMSETTKYIEKIAKNIPVFLINGFLPYENVYSVMCDDFSITYKTTKSLIEHGRERILFLYNSSSYSARQKLSGYKKALEDCSMPFDENLMLRVKNEIHKVKDSLIENSQLNFDAVVSTEDHLAVAVLKYAKEKKISVPKDLSVVGYNNTYLTFCCEPELSTIDSQVEKICKKTFENVINLLQKEEKPEKSTLFEGEFIKRNSTTF